MHVTIRFLDSLSTSAHKKQILVETAEPVSVAELFDMASRQEGLPSLRRELESLMISHRGRLLSQEERLVEEIAPGEEVILLPVTEGG